MPVCLSHLERVFLTRPHENAYYLIGNITIVILEVLNPERKKLLTQLSEQLLTPFTRQFRTPVGGRRSRSIIWRLSYEPF